MSEPAIFEKKRLYDDDDDDFFVCATLAPAFNHAAGTHTGNPEDPSKLNASCVCVCAWLSWPSAVPPAPHQARGLNDGTEWNLTEVSSHDETGSTLKKKTA